MKFTHLHVHSHYSLLDGLPKIDQLLDYVKELGMDSVALTDHGVLYGAVEFFQKAKARGIKPIIGVEIYIAFEKMSQKRPNIDNKRYHLVLLAKNKEGYENLVKLVTKAHLEGFYYKPRIDEELLEKHSKGLIASTACLAGKIPRLILSNKLDEAEKLAQKYNKIFGQGNFYLEIQHHPNIPEQEKVNKELINISKKYGIPLIATNDVHYLKPEDAEAQDVLMLINTGSNTSNTERKSMKIDDFSLKSPKEMIKLFKDVPEAIENTQKIVEKCNFEFELGKNKLPSFDVPDGKTPDQYLEDLCKIGLKERYGLKPDKKVTNRIEYELSVIKETGFASYFLIVQDFVNWAKEKRIVVGPGRGSAGGSIVAYLLNITNIDPLKYDLLFERFLNPERVSMPDIDLDFTDRRRDEVVAYISEKYGRDRVAQIITFGTMAARAAIRDVGRALNYPYNYCDKVAKMIPVGFDLSKTLAEIQEFKNLYKTDQEAEKLIDLALKLEGVIRHASTHACGIVVSKEPFSNLIPLQYPTQNDKNIITQYEMHSIEALGPLKIDLLGLKNLTIIEDTLSRIYLLRNKFKLDINSIPLNDKKTFEILGKGNTIGVFQLESPGFQKYLKQLKPNEFEDIVAMVALYRPGPIQFISDYIERKNKNKKIEYIHPDLEPILNKTQGIMIYQEQIMKIAQKLAGFSLAEADVLRKAIGKKIKNLLFAQKKKFIDGAIKNKIDEKIATQIWKWIEPSVRYSFNKSHAVCYATISYQTAYLKAHYPIEFMAALLTSEKTDLDKIAILIDDCKKMKIEVLPPNINESLKNFTVVGSFESNNADNQQNKIRFGLLSIKNVGEAITDVIVEERKNKGRFENIEDFLRRVSSKNLNKKSLESLIKSGAFDNLAERNELLNNLEKLLEYARETQKNKRNGQKGLFENTQSNNNRISLSPSKPATNFERLSWEKELLGIYVTSHPLEGFKKILEQRTSSLSKITKTLTNQRIRVGGIISNIKKIITRTGKLMLFIKIEDMTDKKEVVVFPSIMAKNPTIFEENKIILISGKVDNRDDIIKIIAEDAEEIVNES
jgi:DNA polymerase III subunit alpha